MKNTSISIKYGIAISVGLIAYFLICALFGVHINPAFSLFNGVIMGFGIYLALKQYRLNPVGKFNYQKGFVTGLLTGFYATVIFTIFFAIYSTEINPEFLNEMLPTWRSDYSTSKGLVFFVVAVMGFATTLVLTLTFMQLLKDSWNPKQAKKPMFRKQTKTL